MADRIKLLIVDDSIFFRSVVTRSLSEDRDIQVVGEASDPYEARDKIVDLHPDVVVIDVEMPHMSGVEFIKILMPQWPLPVIAVSSLAKYEKECLRAGAREFLAKPVEKDPDNVGRFMSSLIKSIKAAAGRPSLRTAAPPAPAVQAAASAAQAASASMPVRESRPGDAIKLLIVDDSSFFRSIVKRGISNDRNITVIGEASDPYEARDKIVDLHPDVVVIDVEMPHMSGVEFIKILMPQWPLPVIAVSSDAKYEKDCLRAGARVFLAKSADKDQDSTNRFIAELIRCIKSAAGRGTASRSSVQEEHFSPLLSDGPSAPFNGIIALGASTGGTQATTNVLRPLPANLPGMVVVQHMPPGFTKMYAESLSGACAMEVREAKDGDKIKQGLVLIAPGELHMEVVHKSTGFYVRCFEGEKVNGHRPSVDVLFKSMAKNVPGNRSVGIILTGMGADGARGITEMRRKGAFTIGQDEKSSVVYGMPREAYEMGGIMRQCSLENIPSVLMNYIRTQKY